MTRTIPYLKTTFERKHRLQNICLSSPWMEAELTNAWKTLENMKTPVRPYEENLRAVGQSNNRRYFEKLIRKSIFIRAPEECCRQVPSTKTLGCKQSEEAQGSGLNAKDKQPIGTQHKSVVRTTEEQDGYQSTVTPSKPA